MRSYLVLFFLCLSSFVFVHAQSPAVYSRVKVDLQRQSAKKLAQLGIDLTHGIYAEGRFYINVFSQEELQLIEAAGYEIEIQVADMAAFLKDPNRTSFSPVTQNCINAISEETPYSIPENFELGTMAGYFTYQEMLDQLDSMHQKYPDLITPRAPIEGGTTIEGRDIFWVRLSDQASIDEEEPEVLHTALHHSREPGSLSQMIFFMWYLLENYDNNPQVQYLVNETEFYFVPCVNPDGYLYNELTNPEGGGFWRKNRRLNSDGSYGVDINRNYGYEWGYDDDGSSTNPESQTYRGETPFSEPETQTIRDFCNAHEFQLALNYHTFGKLLIYPWGFEDLLTPDSLTFVSIAKAMTRSNQYLYGTDSETLNYSTNGASDDWMYGEQNTKPLIFSMTPEVGAEGFWPAEDRIIPNNLQCMEMNLTSAAALHSYGVVQETNGSFLPDLVGDLYFELEAVGLQTGTFEVRLEAVSSNIQSVAAPKVYVLEHLENVEDFLSYTLSPQIQVGEAIVFKLVLDNGHYETELEIRKVFGSELSSFFEDGTSLSQWMQDEEPSTDWGVSTTRYYSAPGSITDSPFGEYENNVVNTLTTNDYIYVADANQVLLNFWGSWDIEAGYDWVQLQVVVDEEEVYPVCGKYTKEGTAFQDFENPVYDGSSDWVQEEIDLTAFQELADSFQLRWVFVSDVFVNGDGFYFDDMAVTIFEDGVVNTQQLGQSGQWLLQNRPNPAKGWTVIPVQYESTDIDRPAFLEIWNSLGQMIWQEKMAPQQQQVELNTSRWPAGVYHYRLRVDGQVGAPVKMTVAK